jgi:hypothetical protein
MKPIKIVSKTGRGEREIEEVNLMKMHYIKCNF